MRFRVGLLITIFIFSSLFFSIPAHCVYYRHNLSGGYYSLTEHTLNATINSSGGYFILTSPPPIEKFNSSGSDSPVSFWDLPLWIKISYISGAVLAALASIVLVPSVIKRVKDIFNNDNRLNIFEYIKNDPGCSISDIEKDLALNRGTINYHLTKLESKSLITIKKLGSVSLLYPKSFNDNGMENIIKALLKNEINKKLLLYIMDNPRITNQELSVKFNLDKSTVHWHLEKFRKKGLIEFERDGKYKRCFIKSEIMAVMIKIDVG